MTYRARLAVLDRLFPARGPCGICGGPDARHRLWDSLDGQSRSADGILGTARWMRCLPRHVQAVREAYDAARRGHRRRPGQYPL